MTVVLEVHQVTKTFKKHRGIRDISLQLKKGEIYGIIGPNGAGKSTLLKTISGLVRPDQGEVRIMGYDLHSNVEQAMKHIGCLIEEPALLSDLTAYRQLQLYARYYENADEQHLLDLLERTGLLHAKDEKVKRFSLGMKQRLGIAMALLGRPSIVCLDEPTNSLDVEGIVQIRALIQSLSEYSQTAFLIASHQMSELQMLSDRVGIVHNGQLIAQEQVQVVKGKRASLEDWYVEQISNDRGEAVHG